MTYKINIHGDFSEFIMYYENPVGELTEATKTPIQLNPSYYDGTSFTINARDDVNLISVMYLDEYLQEIDVPIVNNSATFDINFYNFMENYNIYINTETTTPDREVSGFNKLYVVDNEILFNVAGERFNISGTDLGEYILNLLELPFKLDEDLYGFENEIRLGNHTLQTVATELMTDKIHVDLGTIHVPEKYHNSFDYMNTTIKLHLPYMNSIELDVQYVINANIKIEYILDLYSGDCTVNIHSDKINQIIHSEQMKIGRDIPFIRRISGNVTNTLTTFNGIENNVSTPFIEVIRNKLLEGELVNFVTVYDMINNVSGYIEVTNLLLETNATTNEKDSIISLMSSGVYIK